MKWLVVPTGETGHALKQRLGRLVPERLKNIVPVRIRKKYGRLNFIMVHYLYLISWSILGSIILWGAGLIPYVDAVFFAAGSATQSGLNTINVNDLWLYQQIFFYIIACTCNPIFINTVVVFVRLFWFERRFKHIVDEQRAQRKSKAKTISRTKSEMREDEQDPGRLENGVNGRQIRVLHDTTKPNGMSGSTARTEQEEAKFLEKMELNVNAHSVEPTPEGSNASSGGDERVAEEHHHEQAERKADTPQAADDDLRQSETHEDNTESGEHHLGLNPRLHREITFADEVKTPHEEAPQLAREPDQLDHSRHIEFLQRQQRNAREGGALRIPGPRGFDRGEMPEPMSNEDDLDRSQTHNTLGPIPSESDREGMNTRGTDEMNLDDHTARAGIRFDDQEHPGRRQETATFETAATNNSKSRVSRIKSGVNSLRHRRSNSGLHRLQNAKTNLSRTLTGITTRSQGPADPMPYLSWQATTGRNSAFLGLSETQREELGGIEYRSLKLLAKILLIYFLGFHATGVVIFVPWILRTQPWRGVVSQYSQNLVWWGIFTPQSLFNDLGLTLTPNSMIGFQQSVLVLLYGAFLIIIGNTGFPVMLRFVIWIASKCVTYGSRTWEELRFLLDHPRRCFTLLFPSRATWWLFGVLCILNGVDLIFFIILDLNDKTVTSIPVGYRILNGFFQAASTRTAGFSSVNIADLHPAIQVSYMIMMYISVFPIAISVRRTNVYEEKSLGVFGGEELEGDGNEQSYVGQHLRRQLSFDLWYVFLGFFIICIVEGGKLGDYDNVPFNMFAVLFEITSAYGTVGLSLGYPGTDTSFSAQFSVISKLVIVAMMIRGRHRGLPYALDRAILLPSEKLQQKEEEEANRRAGRRGSIFAEGHENERGTLSWSQTEIDNYGLPRQNTAPATASGYVGSAAGDHSPERHRPLRRRTSGISNASGQRRKRSMSIGRFVASGLSAGPTLPRE